MKLHRGVHVTANDHVKWTEDEPYPRHAPDSDGLHMVMRRTPAGYKQTESEWTNRETAEVQCARLAAAYSNLKTVRIPQGNRLVKVDNGSLIPARLSYFFHGNNLYQVTPYDEWDFWLRSQAHHRVDHNYIQWTKITLEDRQA